MLVAAEKNTNYISRKLLKFTGKVNTMHLIQGKTQILFPENASDFSGFVPR